MKSWQSYLIILLVFALAVPHALAQGTPPFDVDAAAAVLLDYDSGQILYSKNGNTERIPASLVKVMTMFVALDQISQGRASLSDTTRVSENAWRMTGSQMFLEVGETVTLEQLLYGIAVVSGNDACVALAEALAGSADVYVQWMNTKARELGLNMTFVDVHGLSEDNRVTATDMALLARAYIRAYPDALKYHAERSFSYQPRSQKQPIVQYNRNGLLGSFDGADGLKTGHLSAAGYNLVATAKQGERRLIAVVLGGSSERGREAVARELLNYGFRSFDVVDTRKLTTGTTVKVFKGKQRSVGVVAQEPLVTIPQGTGTALEVSVQLKNMSAPVSKGENVGMLTIWYEGEVLKQTPLLAVEDVPVGGFWRVFWDSTVLFFRNLIRRP
ncbi:MAG: D-alanyl-D-alanine carboxypeptidase [Firmicutes bacterium]|nr:D-alanyl-D-alanine carboxypeptidase [Bacillota bacterium]